MGEYQHYIRVDANNLVIHGFSNAFEDPQPTDIQLSGDQGRHFTMQLLDDNGLPIYKIVDGKMVSRDIVEIQSTAEYKQKKRAEINAKWEPQIDKARQDLRRMQDERKIQGQIDKYYNIMKSLIAQRNAELAGVI